MTTPPALPLVQRRLSWGDLDEAAVRNLVRSAYEEDLRGLGLGKSPPQKGDATSRALSLFGTGKAQLTSRSATVVCGLPLLHLTLEVFEVENAEVETHVIEGARIKPGTIIATLTGDVAGLLAAERTLLNLLQHLCGVAAAAQSFSDAVSDSSVGLLDTRKTTPGFRALQKYAVAIGGFFNHRFGLFERILIKDNHLAAEQAMEGNLLTEAVRQAKRAEPNLLIEVEVDYLEQIAPALEGGADALLLDNFTPEQVAEAMDLTDGRTVVEASGGITLDNVRSYASARPHFISTGAPVHQSAWADLGLDWLDD